MGAPAARPGGELQRQVPAAVPALAALRTLAPEPAARKQIIYNTHVAAGLEWPVRVLPGPIGGPPVKQDKPILCCLTEHSFTTPNTPPRKKEHYNAGEDRGLLSKSLGRTQ